MPLPTLISDLSQTPASNGPAGGDAPNILDDGLRLAYAFIAQLRDGAGFASGSVFNMGGGQFYKDANGGIGLGTTSPNFYSGFTTLTLNNGTNGSAIDWSVAGARTGTFVATASAVNLGSFANVPVTLSQNNVERMRLDTLGARIGSTTTAYAPGERLSVAGSATNNGIGVSVIGGGKGIGVYNGQSSGVTSGTMVEFQNSSSVVVGSITANGTATSYNTTSDARLKDAIADAEEAGQTLDAIKVRQFRWKADGSLQPFGFIAQELADVVPSAVYRPEYPDQFMSVDYSKLVPLLVREVQSLRRRVSELEQA